MASYKAWKACERRAAKLLRGVRIWRQDYGDKAPDGESETHIWDCKAYAKIWAITRYVEAEAKYREYGNGRRFVLYLFSTERPRAGDFILVRATEYAADQDELESLRKNKVNDG